MPNRDAVDYSFSRANAAQLAASGIKLVARYLSHTPAKNLSLREVQDLHAHGLGILLNWESSTGRPLGGASNGTADGKDAAVLAEQIGAPHGLTIYYSCDQDTNSSQYDTIAAYYRAAGQATAGHYKVGIYGEAALVDAMHARGVVTSEWQTYAWSNGRLSAQADLYQYLNGQTLAGASVDFNTIIHPELLGAWWPAGNPYGADMPITDQEFNRINQGTRDAVQTMITKDAPTQAAIKGLISQVLKSGGVSLTTDLTAQTARLEQHLDPKLAAFQTQLAALQASVTHLQVGQVDASALAVALVSAGLPVKLATELAQHLTITAK